MSGTSTIDAPATAAFGLDDWLRWQEGLNPRLVDLDLERPRRVAARMGLERLGVPVMTVAGTNGKGSCVAYLAGILECAGYPVAAYTSPHLMRYNESLRVGGREVNDAELIAAFERVEQARGDVALTFFEFRTLAALDIIRQSDAAVAILEVGLGGRLDAVNLIDADVAIVTSIDVDHTDWLGADRESVGREKAGIFRRERPAVCADAAPPESVVSHAAGLGAALYRLGREFRIDDDGDGWSWRGPRSGYRNLPEPAMPGACQRANAGAALMALELLAPGIRVTEAALRQGIATARLPGRQQILPGALERIVDVAHNADAARALAATLDARAPALRTHAVLAMLADKDADAVAGAMGARVDAWYTATLRGPRGGDGGELATIVGRRFPGARVSVHGDVAGAWNAALQAARPGDRVVAFGSFQTAREVLSIARG